MSIRLHALAFCRNGDKDLSPGHLGLSQFKGPRGGFVSGRNVLHSPLKRSYVEAAMLCQGAFSVWGGTAVHASPELPNPPCEQDPLFVAHEGKVRQRNPLIRDHVQHKPGGLLI